VPIQPLNYAMAPTPRSTSKAAIASVVLGIILCIPLITGIPAIILGFIGIRQTRDPMVRGRGMAIAGLASGLVNVCVWSIFGVCLGVLFVGSSAPRHAAHDWVYDLSTSQAAAARSLTSASFAPQDFSAVSTQLSSLGPLQDMTSTNVNITDTNGVTSCRLDGVATFASQQIRAFTLTLARESGVWKVTSCTIGPRHP
jgi:hypothetical protein